MSWRNANSLHIYVPPTSPYELNNWVDQVLGEVVRPLFLEHSAHIRWMWIMRQSGAYDVDSPPANYPLPPFVRSNGIYRCVIFRLSATDPERQGLLDRVHKLVEQAGAFTPGWNEYDVLSELGSDRFVRPDASEKLRANRAYFLVNFLDSTVKLMLGSLSKDEAGRWRLEPNADPAHNPNGSFFESVHYLFCNATGVPLDVLLSVRGDQLTVGTHWMQEQVTITFDPAAGFPDSHIVENGALEPIPVAFGG